MTTLHNRIALFTLTLLWTNAHYAMESNNTMQLIKQWEDVKPFAGKIVAYTTTSSCFCSKKSFVPGRYVSNSKNQPILYGYVTYHGDKEPWSWCCGETGYPLSKLIRKSYKNT